MRSPILIILVLLPLIVTCQTIKKDSIKVFFMGGQSNMTGYGYNSDLPNYLNTKFEDVWIFHGNSASDEGANGGLGIWDKLKPGHGVGFTSDGANNTLSNRFGPELSFARRLNELYPNEKIAIIKYSRNGSSLDCLAASDFGCWETDIKWKPINQYNHFLSTVRQAINIECLDKDIEGSILVPSGIIWMQGESDAGHSEEVANSYYSNLKTLMSLIRASFHAPNLPVVIGKISDSGKDDDGKVLDYCELVQYAQEKYVKTDKYASIVRSTRYYKFSDTWHYDSNGYIDLGEKFAESIYQLSN